MNTRRSITVALRCYPSWWRERYGDEVRVHAADMIFDGRSTFSLFLSLITGALRTRWSAKGMPKDYGVWSARNRSAICWATLSWLVCIPIALDVINPFSYPEAPRDATIHDSVDAIGILLLAALALFAVSWLRLIAALWRSPSGVRLRAGVIACLPPLFLVAYWLLAREYGTEVSTSFADVSGTHVGYQVSPATPDHPVGFMIMLLVLLGGWLTTIVSVAVAANGVEMRPKDLRSGTRMAMGVAGLFACFVGVYLALGVGLIGTSQPLAPGIHLHQVLWWIAMLGLLVAGFLISVVGATRAMRSWQVLATELVDQSSSGG